MTNAPCPFTQQIPQQPQPWHDLVCWGRWKTNRARTRRIGLAIIGRIYSERCKDILCDIEEVEDIAGERADNPPFFLGACRV